MKVGNESTFEYLYPREYIRHIAAMENEYNALGYIIGVNAVADRFSAFFSIQNIEDKAAHVLWQCFEGNASVHSNDSATLCQCDDGTGFTSEYINALDAGSEWLHSVGDIFNV